MEDYSERRKRIENSVITCRTGKRYTNNYADRSRAPIASFFLCGNLSTSPLWGYSHRGIEL